MSNNFISVLVSILLLILSEWVKQLFFNPLQDYKNLKAEIACILIQYANVYTNPIDITKTNNQLPEVYIETSKELRRVASELQGFIEKISCIKFMISNKDKIKDAIGNLMGLSNNMCKINGSNIHIDYVRENLNSKEAICKDLKLHYK